MKSCVGCHSFVVILIGNCEVTSCGMCFWYLDPTNDVSDGYRTLVSSAWPVKGFAWSMRMHELDVNITLVLVHLMHQTDPPK